jgi:hypothetical protein
MLTGTRKNGNLDRLVFLLCPEILSKWLFTKQAVQLYSSIVSTGFIPQDKVLSPRSAQVPFPLLTTFGEVPRRHLGQETHPYAEGWHVSCYEEPAYMSRPFGSRFSLLSPSLLIAKLWYRGRSKRQWPLRNIAGSAKGIVEYTHPRCCRSRLS